MNGPSSNVTPTEYREPYSAAESHQNSPLILPSSIGAQEAQRRSAVGGRPVVFWRPGCKYCIRLRIRLGRSVGQLHWVNVWRDPAGAAAVRAVNDGNETSPRPKVPT